MNVDEILTALQERRIDPGEAEAMLHALRSQPARQPVFASHPLLQQNVSGVSQRRFVSEFSGDEFFLADHIVQGNKLLPAVAFLEMARLAAASELAQGNSASTSKAAALPVLVLNHVTWERPLIMGSEPLRVYLASPSGEANDMHYEIYTLPDRAEHTEESKVVHSRGSALLQAAKSEPRLDLLQLRGQCAGEPLTGASCYEIFATVGVQYGPAFRMLTSVSVGIGEHGRRFALARFVLPAVVRATGADYVLHPSVMDAAFQAPIGLLAGGGSAAAASRSGVPFAVEEVQIFGACPVEGVVLVREARDSTVRVQKFDIDVSDLAGRVCVRLQRFTARVIEDAPRPVDIRTTLLTPRLETDALLDQAHGITYAQRWIVFCEVADSVHASALVADDPAIQCIQFPSTEGELAERFEHYAQQLLMLLQRILGQRPTNNLLLQLLVPAEGAGWLLSGLAGMLRTLQLENPKMLFQVIGVPAAASSSELGLLVEQNATRPQDNVVRYLAGVRNVERLSPLQADLSEALSVGVFP